MPENLTKARH